MKLGIKIFLSAFLSLTGCQTVFNAQGEIAGEPDSDSIILQSRLTAKVKPLTREVPGRHGFARFEIATSTEFANSFKTAWQEAVPEKDFIVKWAVSGLKPATRYYYRLLFGPDREKLRVGPRRTFKTLGGETITRSASFVVVTGMNYEPFHLIYDGPDRHLGYPALKAILDLEPDFFVSTGDSVYYDIPSMHVPEEFKEYRRPAATTRAELRQKWHEQLVQPRFVQLFARVPTYWQKDDHDFRYNDCDVAGTIKPSPELGAKTFLEQVPVVDPDDPDPVTYRTYRVNKLLQIWLPEGRDYRSPHLMPAGPDKTLWGAEQKTWLKRTLKESDATFKLLISSTPMIGPDDTVKPMAGGEGESDLKQDNHSNPAGFQHERDEFFAWLVENKFLEKNFYIVCGDRHWQYHSISPEGVEEFSCGALVDANSRLGRPPGDPESNDPDAKIRQPYTQTEPSGGFLRVSVDPGEDKEPHRLIISWYDENGQLLHSTTRLCSPPSLPPRGR